MILLSNSDAKHIPLPDESVNCVVTSSPYYGLRDYNVDGQIGLEQTPDEYVKAMVQVFRELWRVLRKDGTVWLNLGDSYVAKPKSNYNGKSPGLQSKNYGTGDTRLGYKQSADKYKSVLETNLKPKDLIGIPWRVAFALQADGWWLRQDIIWHKPNPMPESVKDRCTKAHEYIFLLTKSARYFYDNEAIKEDCNQEEMEYRNQLRADKDYIVKGPYAKNFPMHYNDTAKRNKRSVWTVTTKPYPGSHYAVFPPDLIEPCILAGCPEGGTVLDPFAGSGTTCMVARKHRRNAIGLDLNFEYLNKNARTRLQYGDHVPIAIGVNQLTIGV